MSKNVCLTLFFISFIAYFYFYLFVHYLMANKNWIKIKHNKKSIRTTKVCLFKRIWTVFSRNLNTRNQDRTQWALSNSHHIVFNSYIIHIETKASDAAVFALTQEEKTTFRQFQNKNLRIFFPATARKGGNYQIILKISTHAKKKQKLVITMPYLFLL